MKELTIPELQDTATILNALAAPDTLAVLQFVMGCDTSYGDIPTEEQIAEGTPFDVFTVKWNINKLVSVGIVAVTDVGTFSEPEQRIVAINPDMPDMAFHIIHAIWPILPEYQG